MSPSWDEIRSLIEVSRLAGDIERSAERVRLTAEVFTPSVLVCRLLSHLPIEALGPGKMVLDPACGDGQFLFAVKTVKTEYFGMPEDEALDELFGVDILPDNVRICRERLGGGFIAIGNALHPEDALDGQTSDDRRLLGIMFDDYKPNLFG